MAIDPDARNQLLAEWEARQSPIGFYNLALSYLEAADTLTNLITDPGIETRPVLIFDAPVRHLYAQTWELSLKACLFAQGIRPTKLKKDFGHNILRAWKRVDKVRFTKLNLTAETEGIADHLGLYHSERQFAYPITGVRQYLPLSYFREQSQRFRLSRMEVIEMLGAL